MNQFQQLLIVTNPASTRAGAVSKRARKLAGLFDAGTVTTVSTSSRERANRSLLQQYSARLGPGSLLAIGAGDGTVNMLIEALLTDASLPSAARRTVVLPLWGGNANDLAHMLNGPIAHTNLTSLIQDGHIVAIHPLGCHLTHPKTGSLERLAVNYISFGASAAAAHELNQPNHRDNPLRDTAAGRAVSEVVTAARALLDSPRFTIEEHGRTFKIYERVYINGSRMAKATAVPLKLTDPHFYESTAQDKQAIALAQHALQLTNPDTAAELATTHANFTATEPTWAQFDGEALRIEAGTQIEIGLAPEPFYALSRLL